MYLKRYQSGSVRDALAQARAELGPGALVLSTRLVAAPGLAGWIGRRVVEVTAAVDRGVSENRPPEAPVAESPSEPVPAAARSSSWSFWRRADAEACTDAVVARLCATGLHRSLAEDVAGRLPRRQRRDVSATVLRQALADQLSQWAAGDEDHAGVEVFVGPPGAGKTTTVAKIAAQERARHGARLGLVAADGFRVGAVEQLRLYADIIGSPFVIARSASELGDALQTCRGTWLVDTAGRSPGDDQTAALFDVIARVAGARTHLVLPASLPVRAAERVLARFDPARPSRVVLTRLDEVETMAPLVDLCRERDLPISYLGTGQRVPEDLERATAATLATRLLGDHAVANGAQA